MPRTREYFHLLASADVVLHPFPFGGSKTSADALALGVSNTCQPDVPLVLLTARVLMVADISLRGGVPSEGIRGWALKDQGAVSWGAGS